VTTLPAQTAFTPEDLLRLPDSDQYELVGGRLVGTKTNTLSVDVSGRSHGLLDRVDDNGAT
jgi:hypothetical protein